MNTENDVENFIIVPPEKIPAETLESLISEYVLREGTDYGHHDWNLTEKITHVKNQMKSNELYITYNPELESINIVPKAWAQPILNKMNL